MEKIPKINQYLSAYQAAKYLGIGYTSFYEWKKKEDFTIPSYLHPISGKQRYLKEDLDKILENMKGSRYVDI